MKVALLTHEYPPYPGGIGRFCVEIAAAGIELGHEIQVFAPTHGLSPNDEKAPPSGVPLTRFDGDVFKFQTIARLTLNLRKLLRPKQFDLIHISDWPMLIAYNLAFPLCRTPITITLHGTDIFTLARSAKAQILLSRHAFGRASHICANSKYTLSLAERELSTKHAATKSVTYLAASDYWSSQPSDIENNEFNDFLKDQKSAKYILTTVARIDSRKGHRNALISISKLPPDIRDQTLYLAIGKIVDVALHSELLSLAHSLNVNVAFTGRRSDAFIRACYKKSDAFILLAEPEEKKIEGFGLVFLEAASQGLFSIASNVHAIPEVVSDHISGVLVDPHDHATIASTIARHLSTPRTDIMREKIIHHAKSFSWRSCASKTYGPR